MSENKRLFAKNSLYGVVQKVLIAILTFVTIPVFMSLLGAELFGIFAIISTIGDLSRLTNVGFHIALIKFLSFQGKGRESSQDIMVAFLSMLGIMSVMLVFLILFNDFIILKIFNVGEEYLASSKVLFNCLVFANAFLFVGMPFSAMLESLKLIYKVNILQFVYSIIYWSLILLFVSLGGGLEWVGGAILTAAMVWFGSTVIMSLRAWGPLELVGLKGYYMQSVRKQLGYGLKVYLSGLLGLFTEPLVKILISNFFGVTFVGFVDIGMRIRNQFTRILKAAVWPLFQYFSEFRDKKRAAFLLKDVQEKLILAFIPIGVILVFASKALVSLWIGENVEIITMTLLVITIGSLFGQLAMEPTGIYLGVHHPMRLFFNQIFMVLAITLPVLLLRNLLGFNAVYLAFGLSYLVSFIHMSYCQKKYTGAYMFGDQKKLLKVLVYVAILVVTGFAILWPGPSDWLVLVMVPILVAGVAYLLVRYLRLLTRKEIFVYLDEQSKMARTLAGLFKE